MLKAVIEGPHKAAIVEEAPRTAEGAWVVVKVMTAPMCTEFKGFVSGEPNGYLGHEAAGEVVEVAGSSRLRVGDRVAAMPLFSCGRCSFCVAGDYLYCDDNDFKTGFSRIPAFSVTRAGSAAMAQYLLKPDWLTVPIPDDLSYDQGSMACCALGATFGAVERLTIDALDTVLITGLGPVGLGGLVNARYRGARVIGVEANPWRADLARELGATAVIDPADPDARAQILDLTRGRGTDMAIECAGVAAAQLLCIEMTRKQGSVAFVANSVDATPIHVSADLLHPGRVLMGSWHYNLKYGERVMAQIRAARSQIDLLISHRFSITDIQAAFETQLEGRCAKVLLKPWGSE